MEPVAKPAADGREISPPTSIGKIFADFYCQDARLVIELDGGVHSEADQIEYDIVRQAAIESNGITVLRISNQEVEHDLEGVLEKIVQELI